MFKIEPGDILNEFLAGVTMATCTGTLMVILCVRTGMNKIHALILFGLILIYTFIQTHC